MSRRLAPSTGREDCGCYGKLRTRGAPLELHQHSRDSAEDRALEAALVALQGTPTQEVRLTLIGQEAAWQIRALPPALGRLTSVHVLSLYGSNLVALPREVGAMRSLHTLVLHTSYMLHWLPYSIMRCPVQSLSVSSAALYGHNGNRFPLFPRGARCFPALRDLALRTCLNAAMAVPHHLRDDAAAFFPCCVCARHTSPALAVLRWVTKPVGGVPVPLLMECCRWRVVCADRCGTDAVRQRAVRQQCRTDLSLRQRRLSVRSDCALAFADVLHSGTDAGATALFHLHPRLSMCSSAPGRGGGGGGRKAGH